MAGKLIQVGAVTITVEAPSKLVLDELSVGLVAHPQDEATFNAVVDAVDATKVSEEYGWAMDPAYTVTVYATPAEPRDRRYPWLEALQKRLQGKEAA